MPEQSELRNRFWPYFSIIVGCLLLLIGTLATISYLGLPFILSGDDILGPQLGQMATIFLGLVGGGLVFYHGLSSLRSKPSSPARLPPAYFFVITFAIVLGLGNVLLYYEVAVDLLFPPLFLLGAALPTIGVLAYAGKQLGWPVTWRQGSTALVTGSTLSVVAALVLGAVISALFFVLIMPFELLAGSIEELLQFGGAGFLERFFFSPYVIVALLITALQAPIPEEFAKVIGPAFMNSRLRNERQAFMIGLVRQRPGVDTATGFTVLTLGILCCCRGSPPAQIPPADQKHRPSSSQTAGSGGRAESRRPVKPAIVVPEAARDVLVPLPAPLPTYIDTPLLKTTKVRFVKSRMTNARRFARRSLNCTGC